MSEPDSDDALRNIHSRKEKIVKHRDGTTSVKNELIFYSNPDKTFEDFWKLNRELFIEPPDVKAAEIVTKPITDLSDKDSLYIKIDLNDTDRALFEAKNIIEKHRRKFKYVSKAKYQTFLSKHYIIFYKITKLSVD